MGYAFALSACFGCNKMFSYHPHKVPSIPVNGVKQPVCQSCVDRVNPLREKNGLDPIVPLDGAYAPCEEQEI